MTLSIINNSMMAEIEKKGRRLMDGVDGSARRRLDAAIGTPRKICSGSWQPAAAEEISTGSLGAGAIYYVQRSPGPCVFGEMLPAPGNTSRQAVINMKNVT